MQIYEGKVNATQMRFGIVVSRFNEIISRNLLQGALETLKRHGADDSNITVVWVPGAFEIPLAAKKLAFSGTVDTVICLGAVIRGATPHFEYVASQCASGINTAGLESGLPVIFGVLTTDTVEQAIERAGSKSGNKGSEVSVSAIEMVDLLRQMGLPKAKHESCSKAFSVPR